MQETLNLDQTPPLHKTSVSGSTSDKDWTGMQSDCDHEDELTTSAQMAQNHLLCDVSFDEDEDFEEDEQSPPDYYQCMCCGNVQSRSYSCNRCAGPMSECWY